ncbi:MAG TPA: DUF2064 domain-containing protein [Usitatibacter sp.]|nr:DUF2064 domain-containing protein [Usitatibacter sp.]
MKHDHATKMPRKLYEEELQRLQLELVKMQEWVKARGERVLLIGSDCPAITPAHLAEAAAALPEHDAVFTPAEDGGYVLVGLARALPQAFEHVAWGSDAVMAATRERLAAAGARWHEMPPLWDVDRPDDYHRLQREGLLGDMAP